MYTSTKEFTIEPHCPWYQAQQSYGPPNVNWCEPTVCSIINEPANTWSNLGLLLVGVIIFTKLSRHRVLRDFGIAVFVTGFFSFTYHATNNYFTQFFDFLGMYLATSLPLAIQTQRLRGQSPSNYYSWFWFYMFASTCLFWFFTLWNIPIQHTIILQILGILVLEIFCKIKEGERTRMLWFFVSVGLFGVAQTFSQLDIKRIWCEPENVFLHGHAIWHVISALGLGTLALHYKQVMESRQD